MIFGVVTATFSSIYIAGQVLLWIEHKWPRTKKGVAPATPADAKRPVAPSSAASVS